MAILRKLEELENQCLALGIDVRNTRQPIKGSAFGKIDFVKALEQYFINKYRSEGTLTKGLEWCTTNIEESPMLAASRLPDDEMEMILESDRWVATEKIDGVRCVLTYWPDEGFCLIGRNRLVNTGTYSEFTDQVLGLRRSDTIGLFPHSFVLDGELTSTTKNFAGRVVSDTVLNAITQILSLTRQDSWEAQWDVYQKTNSLPIRYNPFDIFMFKDQNLMSWPLEKRLAGLSKLFQQEEYFMA